MFNATHLRQRFMALINSRSFKFGLPFLITIVGGSFGLKEFAQIRFQFSNKQSISLREDIKKSGIEIKDVAESSIEKQYERVKTMDIDNWEQVRGPRPWEEDFEEKE